MKGDEVSHRDVQSRLAGVPGADELYFVVLMDRIVTAELDVTLRAPGSLEPLTAQILEALSGKAAMSMGELSERLGLTPDAPRQVVAEIVRILERAGDVTTELSEDGSTLVKASPIARKLNLNLRFRMQRVKYLPAARSIGQNMRSVPRRALRHLSRTYGDIPFVEFDWPDLYEEQALCAAIDSTYRASYRSRFAPGDGGGDFRDETLQRSQLLPTSEIPARVSIQSLFEEDQMVFHRCYFFHSKKDDSPDWRIIVRRFPTGADQINYTRYLQRLQPEWPFIDQMERVAQRIGLTSRH